MSQVISSKRIAKSQEPDFELSLDKHTFRDGSLDFVVTVTALRGDKWEVMQFNFTTENQGLRFYQNILGY